MDKNKWELKLHDDYEDTYFEITYFEITNGPISLCATAGHVGETEDEEEAIFKKVTDALNESGIDFHSESPLELKQHIEIQEWQLKYDELMEERDKLEVALEKKTKDSKQWCDKAMEAARWNTQLKVENERLKQSLSKYHDVAIENKSLKAKAHQLVDILCSLALSIKVHPDYTGEENDEWTDLVSIAEERIMEWNTKEQKEGEKS